MEYIINGIKEAITIIATCDRTFLEIVLVSIKVASTSTLLGVIFGVPFGIFIGVGRMPGRNAIITILNTLMSLPTVVVGLTVFSLLSRKGPIGQYGLLFTMSAVVIGQFILIFPIIAGLTVTAIRSLDVRVWRTVKSFGANTWQCFAMLLHEARYGILAAVIAGFGRVFAEVGISMMLGGNIKGYTRTITTAIALETSKGEFALGIALGIILLAVALMINLVLTQYQKSVRHEYV